MKLDDFILYQKDLIAVDKVGQSIEDLMTVFRDQGDEETYNSLILFYSQYNNLKKSKSKGVISHSEEVLEFNKIKDRLVLFLDELSVDGGAIYYKLPHLFTVEDFEEISVKERVLWHYVDRIGQKYGYSEYINRFPQGFYVAKAKLKLDSGYFTKSKNDQIYITLKDNGSNDIRIVFYTDDSIKADTFLAEITKNLKILYNLKNIKYGESWILRNIKDNSYIHSHEDLIMNDLMGAEFKVTILGTKYKKLSTYTIIDFSRIEYERTIRANVLPHLEHNEFLKQQAEIEINEIDGIYNKEINEKVLSVNSNRGVLRLNKKKDLFICLFFSAFFLIYSSIYSFNFYWDEDFKLYLLEYKYAAMSFFVPMLIMFLSSFFLVNMSYFENTKSLILSNIVSIIISLYFLSWLTIQYGVTGNNSLTFCIFNAWYSSLVYVCALIVIGNSIKLIRTKVIK